MAGMRKWPALSAVLLRLLLAVEVATLSQNSTNSSKSSNSSNSSNTSSTTATSTTITIDWGDNWPSCPYKGCLPCPRNADGRPNCACQVGYTTTGKPLGYAGREALIWTGVKGWVDRCLPVACAVPPELDYARRVDEIHVLDHVVFPEKAEYLCNPGYFVSGYYSAVSDVLDPTVSTTTRPADAYPLARLISLHCDANATLIHDSALDLLCVPKCGDGWLMPVDHLPMYDPREQCDDGNEISGDGCSMHCRVESGWVCVGGSTGSADSCKPTDIATSSKLVLSISGFRPVPPAEIGNASAVALGKALHCPGSARDIEIKEVIISYQTEEEVSTETTTVAPNTTVATEGTSVATEGQNRFHRHRFSVEVSFSAKVSQPSLLSIDQLVGELRHPLGLMPRLWVAYTDLTSLKDLYVQIIHVETPILQGDESKGRSEAFSLSGTITTWSINLSPVYSYLFLISFLCPGLIWLLRIRTRRFNLMGRFDDIEPEFRGTWAFNICACAQNKILTCSLLCCIPARLAETWHNAGLLPFWPGVRRGVCCCLLYVIPGCQPCGAALAGQMRSNIRDFFGFGDKKADNLEFADCCCYLCCPICCIVQEAKHVDSALRMLPPPMEGTADWMFDIKEGGVGHGEDAIEDGDPSP